MTKLFKISKEKNEFSDRFFRKINPKLVAHFIIMNKPEL